MSAVVIPGRGFERFVHVRRGHSLARTKPIDEATTLTSARARWQITRKHWTSGWEARNDARVALERAADAIIEAAELPRAFDLDTLAAAERMLHNGASLAPAIGARHGARAALDVKMRSHAWNVASGRKEKTWWWMLADAATATHTVDAGWEALRNVVCSADDVSYAAARDAALRFRLAELDVLRRVPIDFAFPSEPQWAADDMRAFLARPDAAKVTYMSMPLLASLADESAYVAHLEMCNPRQTQPVMAYACDVVAAFDPDAATRILSLVARITLGAKHFETSEMQKLACALTSIRSEEMARELATWVRHARFGRHVTWYFERHGDLAEVALGEVAKGKSIAADTARELLEQNRRAQTVDAGTMHAAPPILVSPPWRRRRVHAPMKLETLPYGETIEWEPGEREKIRATPPIHAMNNAVVRPITQEELVEHAAMSDAQKYVDVWPRWQSKQWIVAELPETLRLELWDKGQANLYSRPTCFMLAQHGARALDGLFKRDAFTSFDDRLLISCLRVDSPRTALVCSRVLGRRRTWKERAKNWLLAHAEASAIGLVPAALGPAGRTRRLAERAIRLLAAHRADVLRDVAGRYGDAAREAIEDFAFGDPLARIDVRSHAPRWLDVSRFPVLLARDGRPLARDATANLIEMLAARGDDLPYPGIDVVRDALDRDALAELGWALFVSWVLHGRKRMHDWMPLSIGAFATDAIVARLSPFVREWTHADPRACMTLVDVLSAVGEGQALLELRSIADAARAPYLVEVVTKALGPKSERPMQLGLDARGEAELDLGSRTVRVVLDEALVPRVVLADGRRIAQMPRAAKNDDPVRVARATTFFKRLRHASRSIARAEIRRLERAMIEGRRFTVDELERRWARHPLLSQASKRVVWGVHDGPVLAATFRIVEDGTYADEGDTPFALDPTAQVSVVHPIDLDARALATWGTLFADYEILQPFDQLGRITFTGTPAEAATILTQQRGAVVEGRSLMKTIDTHGWTRPPGRRIASASCTFRGPKGPVVAMFSFSPGIPLDTIRSAPRQTLTEMKLQALPTLEGLRPVDLSELVRMSLALRA